MPVEEPVCAVPDNAKPFRIESGPPSATVQTCAARISGQPPGATILRPVAGVCGPSAAGIPSILWFKEHR